VRLLRSQAAIIVAAVFIVLAGLRAAAQQTYQCVANNLCINWAAPECWGTCGEECEGKNRHYTNYQTYSLVSPGPCPSYHEYMIGCWYDIPCSWSQPQQYMSCKLESDGWRYCRYATPSDYCTDCGPYGDWSYTWVLTYECHGGS
jgi:hypothetical protein